MTRLPAPPETTRRRGFTLIEILVVVTILIILIALLVPAVQTSIRTVRVTAIQTDIGVISSAVTSFKTKYGTEPPSRVVLFENPTDWALPANASHRALIRQFWPQFDFTAPRDLDGDSNTTDTHTLSSGECLVFFLGGMPNPATGGGFSLIPFTKSPTDPFSRSANANRDKPAYEFNTVRLVDVNGNGFPEYRDPYPGQRSPYLYYSSYDGAGYRTTGATNEFSNATDSFGEMTPAHPYLNGPAATAEPFNPRTFQLISPGPDGIYGPLGPYVARAQDPLPAWTWTNPATMSTVNFTVDQRQSERDNITNFGSGMLVP